MEQIMGKDYWLLPMDPDMADDGQNYVKNSMDPTLHLQPYHNTISHNK
jgi:hypothetical protein